MPDEALRIPASPDKMEKQIQYALPNTHYSIRLALVIIRQAVEIHCNIFA